jgi:lysyl-tRNA synthetase class 2
MAKEYIPALEYGLPPTAGEGVGFDRIEMLLTNNASIITLLHSVTSCANR